LKLEKVVALYADLPISEEQKRYVAESLLTFNKKLAGGLLLTLNVDNTTYSSREIFETFMYGQYCHRQEPLRARLHSFKRNQIAWMMANQEFDQTLSLFLEYIFWLRNKNAMAIKALEAQQRTAPQV